MIYFIIWVFVSGKYKNRGGKMKKIADLLAIIGALLFIYTVVGRFVGDKCIMGFTSVPMLKSGFSAVGMFAGIACMLLLAVIIYLREK